MLRLLTSFKTKMAITDPHVIRYVLKQCECGLASSLISEHPPPKATLERCFDH